jgi:uncharacterized SAM-binding protein YcdF (DUF218 family)
LSIVLLLLIGLPAGLYLARGTILLAAARWLDVGSYPQPADYVMVLGGGTQSRPFAAAALFKAGLARHVLVSHVKRSPLVLAGGVPPEDEIVRRVLIARGVPDSAITIIGQQGASTYDEARALASLLKDKPDARVLILTHEFHTRRARWIFREILGSQGSQIAMVSTPSEEFRFDRWWRSREGFKIIAGENLKFLLYVISYGRSFRVAALIVLIGVCVALYYRMKPRPVVAPFNR